MKRVKFYSINDISCGYYLRNSEKLIKEYESGKDVQDINDVIELYNIKKFFDNKIYLKDWTADDVNRYESAVKSNFGTIGRFFNSITENSFEKIYNDVDRNYKDDFWELIVKFKVYEKITEDKFQEFLNTSKVWLYELLKHKNITEYFGRIIRDYMLKDYTSAELLLDKYEMKHISEKKPLYFPKELSNTDKENIICNYIDSEKPNLNYLRLITNIQSSKDKLEISPRTLLKSKKKAEEQERQLFHENSGMQLETTVAFSKSQDEEVVIKAEGQAITATYSTKWIKNHMDYATLLNNFIYLFDFVDLQMRFAIVNKLNHMGVFERFLLTSSQNAYKKGIAFDQMNILSLLQMAGYYNELFSVGIRLEEVFEWFVEEYLSSEFNAHNFKVRMPSANSTFLEKCTSIMPAMESVLKQFSLFGQEGQIDFELLEIRSEHLIYKNIPSLVDKKYAYGVGDEFKKTTFLFFSDQSHLGYNEKAKKSYNNYFELLCDEKSKLNDYPDYSVAEINWLIDHKYLSIDEQEYIVFNDKFQIMILKDLYFNEVICYWKYSESGKKIIDQLEQSNVIEFESSLFSRPEQDYINYFLNKSQFNNGLDLRNKYSHTQPKSEDDEKVHNWNYMIFLRLFILTVIKINDDFCTSDEIRNLV
ncbi:MAG: hypothetical protein CVV03_11065 [Firmicutes bacterium HGW-Firmicutes-8]|nr:MAG: hypothetical protein CVV03_11065 [Firmicutes bacterium HGW-Firmicutes-8]